VEQVAGAKPAPTRRALDILKGDGKGKGKADGSPSDLLRELRDEARLWQLTEGQPLLCEHGGSEHSAVNIRYFRKTRTVPKVCTFAGCGKLLQHAKGEVSFEDGATFLTPNGTNPTTGRNEGRFSIADRALARILIERRELSQEHIVFGIGDLGLVEHVVAVLMVAELFAEAFHLTARVIEGLRGRLGHRGSQGLASYSQSGRQKLR
jgi:hypothetical protein